METPKVKGDSFVWTDDVRTVQVVGFSNACSLQETTMEFKEIL